LSQAALIQRAGRLRLAGYPFLLGALTVLGFAPFYWYLIPALTLAALFHAWTHAGSRRAALAIGFFFGLGWFGAGVSWVYVSMHDFGMMPAPIAALATALFCAFLALFPALLGYLQARLHPARGVRLLLLLPALWTLMEWIRGWLFTGFPWLALGYSQAPSGPLAGYAPVLGVYGVTGLLALAAGLLALTYDRWRGARRQAWWALAALGMLAGTGVVLNRQAWTAPAGAPLSVSLLQGNIAQDMKWRGERLMPTLNTYRDLVLASPGRLIVLPETAMPLFLDQTPSVYFEQLAQHARQHGGDLILGIPERDFDRRVYFNSAISLGTAPPQRYRKQHLVPFGEFIPFKPLFGWFIELMQIPLGDFERGAATQPPLAVAGQQVAVNICYEDVFGEEIIRQLPQATLLANISNDAWFGDSIAPRQHLQISQMRALETGRYLLRATNTGMTAIVNEKGRVVASVAPFHTDALHGQAQGFGGATPYVRFGNLPALLLAGLGLVAGVSVARGQRA
jgi:apolipoprotein N-acyltransferase